MHPSSGRLSPEFPPVMRHVPARCPGLSQVISAVNIGYFNGPGASPGATGEALVRSGDGARRGLASPEGLSYPFDSVWVLLDGSVRAC